MYTVVMYYDSPDDTVSRSQATLRHRLFADMPLA
jgi:hypothetical protein